MLLVLALLVADPTPLAAVPPVKEKKVCRRDETTGSIMPKSVCHTKAEWAQIDAQNAVNTERFRNERGAESMSSH
jgi:hypothetical protein